MPTRPTTLTAAAGEHYVAYYLSTKNYIAALTRGGTPSVDILVSSIDGRRTLGIQVKTMQWCYHERKRNPDNSHWMFDVGWKAVGNFDDSLIYAFVSLTNPKVGLGQQNKPLIFWALPSEIARTLGSGYTRNMFRIRCSERKKYEDDNWSLVTQVLEEGDYKETNTPTVITENVLNTNEPINA